MVATTDLNVSLTAELKSHNASDGGIAILAKSLLIHFWHTTGTQPEATPADNVRMNETTDSDKPDVCGALWIGALMLVSGSIKDLFPAELEEVASFGVRGRCA